MITTKVAFDLRRGKRDDDRSMVRELYAVPKGSTVVIDVGNRTFPEPDTVRWTSEYLLDLHFELIGTLAATQAWERALLGGGA